MVKLSISESCLTVILHQDFLAFRLDEDKRWNFQKIVNCQEVIQKCDGSIECCAFSPCGKYFALCVDKNILIFDTNDWSMVASSAGERKASSLKFFPNSKLILIADKSGCVSFYSLKENGLEKNDLGIGHNSMLTGALISHDEKFIITSDRDEKIRITNYPNVYNIERFCLGHGKFVSWIEFLPSDERILISSSGDGTIRFWNFISGQQLALYSFNASNENQTTLSKFVACQCGDKSILAVLEYKSNVVRIIDVSGDLIKGLKINLIEVLKLSAIPWDAAFYRETLLCLVSNKSNPIQIWGLESDFMEVSQYLRDNWDAFLNMSKNISDNIPLLFKREIDNLQEYEQRKKARLLKTGKTS